MRHGNVQEFDTEQVTILSLVLIFNLSFVCLTAYAQMRSESSNVFYLFIKFYLISYLIIYYSTFSINVQGFKVQVHICIHENIPCRKYICENTTRRYETKTKKRKKRTFEKQTILNRNVHLEHVFCFLGVHKCLLELMASERINRLLLNQYSSLRKKKKTSSTSEIMTL